MTASAFLACIFPFLKEMFKGIKLKDTDSVESKPGYKRVIDTWNLWIVDKVSQSHTLMNLLFAVAIGSVLINVELMKGNKSFIAFREQEHNKDKPKVEPKETKNVPNEDVIQKDILFEKTKKELEDLYGELK